MTNHNSRCIFQEVTRQFLRGFRANAWEDIAEDALRKEWEVFGFERLNKHQEEALRLVVESKSDVFVNLPTGLGKSVVFQVLSMIVYSYVEPTKVEPKKPDALAGYAEPVYSRPFSSLGTANVFFQFFFPQNDAFTDRGTD